MAHTAPNVKTRMTRWATSACQCEPPATVRMTRKGTATPRKAIAAIQAASSLPMTISWLRSAVACSSARVASARSPLIDVADSVGATMSPIPRTKQTTTS